MFERILIIGIVLTAVSFLLWKLRRKVRGGCGCGDGACGRTKTLEHGD